MLNTTWDRVIVETNGDVLGPEPLRRLSTKEVPVIVLKGLFSPEELAGHRERLMPLRSAAAVTSYVNGSLTLIGTFLIKYLPRLDDYFRDANAADARLADHGFDLPAQARARLQRVFGMERFEVATEPDGRRYASSNVRICADGINTPLHNDNIMRDGAPHPIRLAKLQHQLSCVVCLQTCDTGGELSIYRKSWEPEDEIYKIPSGLGYEMGVVANSAQHRFKPSTGDVYLLNPTNYHAVERASGADRMTLGFFFGFFDNRMSDGVAWV